MCIVGQVPFEIPDSWEWVRLGSVCEIARGGSPRPIKQYLTESPDGINWIKIGDTDKDSKYINSTKEKIIVEGVTKSRLVHKGDFLLTNSMSFGRPYILNIDGCIHDGWLMLSNYQTVYDKDFLYYMLSSRFAYYQFCGVVSGAVVKNLNTDKVEISLMPVPPISEQKRIVTKIEELLPHINEYEKCEAAIIALNKMFPEQLKKSILQEAVQGKLVPQEPSDEPACALLERIREEKARLIKEGKIKKDKNESVIFRRDNSYYEKIGDNEPVCIQKKLLPFEIPDSWEWVRLNNIFSVINGDRGKNYPAKSTLSNNGIPFISAVNLDGKSVVNDDNLLCLSEAQYDKLGSGKLIKDDVVVCIRGSLGKHGKFPFDKGAIASSLVILRSIYNEQILSEFIMMFLDSPLFFDEIKKFDNGTAQPNLAAKSLEQFFVPIPPLAEQKRIICQIEQLLTMAKCL